MVRHALPSDIPAIVELALREHQRSPWRDMAFDSIHAGMVAHSFMQTYGRVVFRSERGYLAGLLQPLGFSREPVALEYAYYCEDGCGRELLARFEQWAERMGARAIVMHDHIGDGRLGRVLQRRRNYTPLGAAYLKRL